MDVNFVQNQKQDCSQGRGLKVLLKKILFKDLLMSVFNRVIF